MERFMLQVPIKEIGMCRFYDPVAVGDYWGNQVQGASRYYGL
jgi:hypothetical protein